LDAAVERQVTAESRLREAELSLERSTAMEAVSSRRYFNHKEFVADLDMLALEVEAAHSRLRLAIRQLEKVERTAANMVIRAPFDGRIVAVNQPGNINIAKNEQVFVLEKSSEISVTAFLDQDQVLSIGLNDIANVYLPSLGRTIQARVLKIDRDNAYLDRNAAEYRWSDGNSKSAAVSLEINLEASLVDHVQAGLPAVVVFPRRSSNELFNRIEKSVKHIAGSDVVALEI
jgi:multidrug resistance efflux pump